MELKTVHNQMPKAKVSIQGVAGSGKTYAALLLAHGLTHNWSDIALIETNHGAAEHYGYLGPFNVVSLAAPFTSATFASALQLCMLCGAKAIIIDSLSAEWVGSSGVLDKLKEQDPEALFEHESLMLDIERCSCHLLATLQTEECYHLSVYGGERRVEKHGLKPLQERNIQYRFHTSLYVDMQHKACGLKDRTSFFEGHPGVVIDHNIAGLFGQHFSEEQNNIVSLNDLDEYESFKTSA